MWSQIAIAQLTNDILPVFVLALELSGSSWRLRAVGSVSNSDLARSSRAV